MRSTEFRVPVPGGTISGHVTRGRGPEILLVPSVGYSEEVWTETVQQLGHCRVVTFDLRGHGRSDCEVEEHAGEVADDLRLVADALGLQAPVVVGHQLGGSIAAMAAARHPGRFGALCLLDSPATMTCRAHSDFVEVLTGDVVLDQLVERFGLGLSGRGRRTLDAFLDEYATRVSGDWIGMAMDWTRAREAMSCATAVDDRGHWQRRPTTSTCRLMAHMPADLERPGSELLATLDLPVWVVQPEEGDYRDGYAEFAAVAQERPGWAATTIPGGVDVLHRPEFTARLTELLAPAEETAGHR